MITRIWQAWTSPQNAGAYEALLQTQIFPAVRAKGIQGLMHMELPVSEDRNPAIIRPAFASAFWAEAVDL